MCSVVIIVYYDCMAEALRNSVRDNKSGIDEWRGLTQLEKGSCEKCSGTNHSS